jgi:2-phospho-L-lactate/phosphoenolpyruvate guanylyltransferase
VTTASLGQIVALVPVRSLSGAKTRLGEPLDAEERTELIRAMLRHTVHEARAAAGLDYVMVVSMDGELLEEARAMGASSFLQDRDGLNQGLEEARRAIGAGATALMVLPVDLPGVSAAALETLVTAAESARRTAPDHPAVVVVPDRHGTGTNALLLVPPDAIPFRFGEGSRAAHAAAARSAGASYVELTGPLDFDLDTPADLLEADMRGLDHEAGR